MPGFIKYLVVTSVLSLLMAGLPSLTLVTAVFWGGSLILAAVYLNWKQLLSLVLFNMLLLYLFAGGSVLFYCLAFFGLSALVMSLLVNRGQDYYQVQKWGMAAAVAGVTLFIMVIYATTGQSGTGEMEKQLNLYLQESMQEFEQSGIMELYEKRGIDREELENGMEQMIKTTARHLPAFYYLQAILASFSMLFLPVFLYRRADLERLKKRPYTNEIMPWQLAWVVIIGLALWLLGRDEMNSLYYAGSNLLVVMVPVSVYFGLSAVLFKLRQQKTVYRKWYAIALIILSIFFLPSAVIFFSIIGVFDALLDYRKLRLEKEDGI
ncbi:DUF2232 domain-containing protein [Syntrophomonas curvata]